MPGRRLKTLAMSLLLASALCHGGTVGAVDDNKTAGGTVDFIRQVRPILKRRCYSCHGATKQEGGLRLDVRDEAFRGGDSGPVIAPRNSERSRLIARIRSTDESQRMPLNSPALRVEEITLLSRWIDGGADWPESASQTDVSRSRHWSFRPITRPKQPGARARAWIRNSIDAFVLARLEAAGIQPSAEAEWPTLIRRLHLDLTGLPPPEESLQRLLNDRREDAYARLVDRLLASPHFGERWGQHWLDLARYADSDGYEMDYPRPNAWRWRDWVIWAVNSDMPFDKFTAEQIAGDLLPGATWRQHLATGFHRNTLTNTENGIDKEEFRIKSIIDRVNTTGTVWLGLTVGCAECHSHKYDPIRQVEYYRLFAFFNDRVDETETNVEPTATDRAAHNRALKIHAERVRELQAAYSSAAGAEREKLKKQLARLRQHPPKLKVVTSTFQPRRQPRESHIHLRGNFLDRGARVFPNVPDILPPLIRRRHVPPDRLDLARWLVSDRNPLTARVAANRVWQQLFGTGLVATPDDFGKQGARPTHPHLLDWLAFELMRNSWSRKALVRRIVTSATYRQASAFRPELAEIDPLNRRLARQNRFRLKAEFLRDQYLAASGLFNARIGGPSFHPPLPAGMSQLGFRVAWKPDADEQQHRRGMYIVTRRNLAQPMLSTFDRPSANVTCTKRERSNTPLQSLTQMNDPLIMDCARALAARLAEVPAGNLTSRIERAITICLSRPATIAERDALLSLHAKLIQIYSADRQAAAKLVGNSPPAIDLVHQATWIILARTIMNLDEFVTRE